MSKSCFIKVLGPCVRPAGGWFAFLLRNPGRYSRVRQPHRPGGCSVSAQGPQPLRHRRAKPTGALARLGRRHHGGRLCGGDSGEAPRSAPCISLLDRPRDPGICWIRPAPQARPVSALPLMAESAVLFVFSKSPFQTKHCEHNLVNQLDFNKI